MKQAYVTLDVNRLSSIHGRFRKERIPKGEAKTSFLHFDKKHFMRANPSLLEAIFVKMSTESGI